jgi:hypothetical protein
MNVNVCKWVLTPPAATAWCFLGDLGVRCNVFVKNNKCFFRIMEFLKIT